MTYEKLLTVLFSQLKSLGVSADVKITLGGDAVVCVEVRIKGDIDESESQSHR